MAVIGTSIVAGADNTAGTRLTLSPFGIGAGRHLLRRSGQGHQLRPEQPDHNVFPVGNAVSWYGVADPIVDVA